MQDAFGGILNVTIIAVFLVIVSSTLGLTVNYTKAFRLKNYVISTIEEYEGSGCGCTEGGSTGACVARIEELARNIRYTPVDSEIRNCDGRSVNGLFCCKKKSGENVYTVTTQVNVDLPIINRIFEVERFRVHGDTRPVK